MRTILTVVGARPQFIKAAPVCRELRKFFREVLVHTGQHYDRKMSDVFFDELGIPEPDHNLGVGSGSHGAQTGEMMARLEQVVMQERPDQVLVYGDTNSTLAGALVAAKLHIPVAHVEAGLRSFNREMPEEINRVVTDHVSSILFTPTETATRNLTAEGITRGVHEVGDVMYDAVLDAQRIADSRSTILAELGITPGSYRVLTVHRAENTDSPDRLAELIEFVNRTSAGAVVIFPVHPRTRGRLESAGARFHDKVRTVEPLGYFDMLSLVRSSSLVYTDSGGLQKEAYWLGVPCITLRDETEWVETVSSGWNVLYRNYRSEHRPSEAAGRRYGDGRAALRIAEVLRSGA